MSIDSTRNPEGRAQGSSSADSLPLLVLTLFLAGSLAGVLALPVAALGAPPVPVDWDRFIVDANHDRLDDSLEAVAARYNGDATYDIVIRYDHYPDGRILDRLADLGLQPAYISKAINATILYQVPARHLWDLASAPGTVYVEPMPELHYTMDVAAPTLLARDSSNYSPNTVWEMGYTGEGINIAIMDSGVNNFVGGVGHESLDDMDDNPLTLDPKLITGVDCLAGVCIPTDPELGDSGHGTHVAGIATGTGGQGEDSQYRGVAPGSRLIDVRVGIATNVNIAAVYAGYDWAIANVDTDWEFDGPANDGIHILSQSFGGAGGNGQDALSLAMNEVAEAGIICVVAAGNSGGGGLGAPAVADHAITIANINDKNTINRNDDSIAGSSSRGPRATDGDTDNYDEMKPDVAAPGTQIMAPAAWSKMAYANLDGTSMACPAVAGVLALIVQANPDLMPSDSSGLEWPLKRILHDTAQDYGSATFPMLSSKFDGAYGWGQVDAYGAVNRALNLKTTTMGGDSFTYSRQDATISGSTNFIRSQWTTEDDELVYSFSIPASWGRPSNFRVTSGHTYELSTSVQPQGGGWKATATVTLTEPPSRHTTAPVTVLFDTEAPLVTSNRDYDFDIDVEMNELEASSASYTVTVAPSVEPDLVVQTLTSSIPVPNEGQEVTIGVPVSNEGDEDATGNLRVASSSEELLDGDITVDAGSLEAYAAIWDTTGKVGTTQFTATVSGVAPPESDLSNNQRSISIRVNGRPVAELRANVTEAETDEPIRFDGSGSTDERTVERYRFDLGDGNQTGWITADNYEHAYGQAGEYQARLQVRDDDGWASEWVALDLMISGPPVAKLTANLTLSRTDWVVTLNASDSFDSDGQIEDFRWDLDDGNVTGWMGDDPYYYHGYTEPGLYFPRVQARDDEDRTSKWSSGWSILVNGRPVARLEVNATVTGQGQWLTFNGTDSTDDTAIAGYRFDLDGAGVSDWQASPVLEYAFEEAGYYYVRLQVKDEHDWKSEWTERQEIHINAWPVARLEANTTLTRPGWEIEFDGSESEDPEGNLADYRFDFGDGEVTGWSGEVWATHAYTAPGQYQARLQVRDGEGSRSGWSAPLSIRVNSRPVAVVVVESAIIKEDQTITFDGSDSLDDGSITEYRFDPGDGNVTEWQDQPRYDHAYPRAGNYLARAQVRDDQGWESLWSMWLEVVVVPPQRLLGLESDAGPVVLKPREWMFIDLNLTNAGEITEEGDLELVAYPSGWDVELSTGRFQAASMDRFPFQVEVRTSSRVADGQYETITVEAIPDETYPGERILVNLTFIIDDPVYRLEASLDADYLAVAQGETDFVTGTLVNTGNRPLLPVSDHEIPQGWQVDVISSGYLEPLGSAVITLWATAPSVAREEQVEVVVSFVANSTQDQVSLQLVDYVPTLQLTQEGRHEHFVPRGALVILGFELYPLVRGELTLEVDPGTLDLSMTNFSGETIFVDPDARGTYAQWETVEGEVYLLYLDNQEGYEHQTLTLDLVLESIPDPSSGDDDDDSPGPGVSLILIMLGALGLLLRRKRKPS